MESQQESTPREKWKTFPGAPTSWSRPTIRPLPRLGELTTPTTFSASSPDRHGSDISEMRKGFLELEVESRLPAVVLLPVSDSRSYTEPKKDAAYVGEYK